MHQALRAMRPLLVELWPNNAAEQAKEHLRRVTVLSGRCLQPRHQRQLAELLRQQFEERAAVLQVCQLRTNLYVGSMYTLTPSIQHLFTDGAASNCCLHECQWRGDVDIYCRFADQRRCDRKTRL